MDGLVPRLLSHGCCPMDGLVPRLLSKPEGSTYASAPAHSGWAEQPPPTWALYIRHLQHSHSKFALQADAELCSPHEQALQNGAHVCSDPGYQRGCRNVSGVLRNHLRVGIERVVTKQLTGAWAPLCFPGDSTASKALTPGTCHLEPLQAPLASNQGPCQGAQGSSALSLTLHNSLPCAPTGHTCTAPPLPERPSCTT